jgi:hypothetical protein
MGRLQRRLAQCYDMIVRRTAVTQALCPRTGERVLEIGGGDLYAYDAARSVGPTGRVCAVVLP